jgi:hypothetical protein
VVFKLIAPVFCFVLVASSTEARPWVYCTLNGNTRQYAPGGAPRQVRCAQSMLMSYAVAGWTMDSEQPVPEKHFNDRTAG